MSFASEQRTVRAKVIALCEKYVTARLSYSRLVSYYWRYVEHLKVKCDKCGKQTSVFIQPQDFARIKSPESITRAFRKAVELGEITLTEKEQAERARLEDEYRDFYGNE
jgi:arginyl-tRNA--protein-N-Asp/Glu arginylyltransferase